jgi:hypothetical protein
MPRPARTLANKFWARVPLLYRNADDRCWKWAGWCFPQGYGRLYDENRKSLRAHRVSWALHYGPVPKGMSVLHHCDNPPCVNPRHLFLGTQTDNQVDMNQKGRRGKPKAIGVRNPNAKLTECDIRVIRKLAAEGFSQRELATNFCVHHSSIYAILRLGAWAHVS